MAVDSQVSPAQCIGSPRVLAAAFQARRLNGYSVAVGGVAIALLGLAAFAGLFAVGTLWASLLLNLAAAFIVLLAGLRAAWVPVSWRAALLKPAANAQPLQGAPAGWYERGLDRINRALLKGARRLGLPPLELLGWSLLALLCARLGWNLDLLAGQGGAAANVGTALCLLLAFTLLVFERHLAQTPGAESPEAALLVPLLRLVLGVLLLASVCLLFYTPGNVWAVRLASLLGVPPALVATELALRAVMACFSPRQEATEPKMLADSFAAGLLRWPPRPWQALQNELHGRFGIDLRQVWAFNYMRRAALPVLAGTLALGWVLTGVRQVPLQARGVYERFGSPQQVWAPGLHWGLPWPLGQVVEVENGLVHALATGLDNTTASVPSTADGPAPASAHRLWDASHVRDNTQVIASGNAGQQNFQVVNMDVRFIYRIGLSDADALAATYHSADVPQLIRDTASRVLVHALAARTLDGLLGADRHDLAQALGQAVQADLDHLGSGVEVLATVVEAIHPPAGAANAYHAVQAAQISAQALVAQEQGAAAERTSQARLNAFDLQAQAQAGARETQAAAQAAARTFGAEREGYAAAGQAFVFERYLAQLGSGLAHAQLLVLDHRLGGVPTLDLRHYFAPVGTPPPRAVR